MLFFMYSLSRLASLLGMVLFTVECILGARIKLIEVRFGQDQLIELHRKLGIAAVLFASFHSIFLLIINRGGFLKTTLNPGMTPGFIAFGLLILMTLYIVFDQVLHLKYEIWKNVHRLNYLIFPLAYLHSLLLGAGVRNNPFLQTLWVLFGLSFILLIVSKILNYLRVRRNRYEVIKVVRENHDIWTIHLQGPKLDNQPGQFIFLRLSRDSKLSSSHPFTIASSPKSDTVELSIKAGGDFSRTIGATKAGDYAFLDGPYGKFSFLNYPGDRLVFIAGGIGITPFLSTLRYLRDQKIAKNVTLLWGNKTENDLAFREELHELKKTVNGLQVVHILSEQSQWNGETGLIDMAVIQKYAGDIREMEVFLCGPPPMIKMVRKELRKLRVPKSRIHFELFNF